MKARIVSVEKVIVVFLACLLLILTGCTEKGAKEDADTRSHGRASVSEEGRTIVFPPGSPGLQEVASAVVNRKTAVVSVIAPARVVASIAPMMTAEREPIVLFESPDITSLYSQYRQGKTNVERTAKNLTRTKDMFENHAATGKDVTDAETDAANARASFAEFEGKLRAAGFNPAELANAKPGTVWLIADVTETQLHDVDKGEDVDIFFSSFPDKKVIGKAEAVGEVVDPATRTVKVRVTAPNHQGKLLPGMFARVDFGDPVPDVFVLPPSAIATVEGKDYVFVESAPGEYHRRQVVIRYSSADQVVLSTGLQDGERIVTTGTMLLKGLSFGY
jgi:cobalt-zinc-cadmium efflux system membrane fusion protein